jgi:AcrR family transcriptional regulator
MLKDTKKPYHHGDLKAALIRAGLEILEDLGLEALSLRAIAARVGVSHTAPKNHFDGLQGLLAAIAAEGFRRHAAEMQRGVEGVPPGRARLIAACDGYVRFARANPALFRLMFSSRFDKTATTELQEAASASYAVLRSISRGLDWPRPGRSDQEGIEALRTETMLWSFVHGYALLMIDGRLPRDDAGDPLLSVLDVMPVYDYGA